MTNTKLGDFIEIKYTGFQDGKVFDSNIESDLKQLNPEAKPQQTIVIIGQDMVVKGLDKALENKELNKEYEIHIDYKDGFGERKRELVKTIPLAVFTKHKINPQPGQTLFLDNALARVITISGARVMTDFNNPLAGKAIDYKFKITRILIDEKEKIDSYFKFNIKTIPKYEINENKIIIIGEDSMKHFVTIIKDKFTEIFKKDLEFKEEKTSKIEDLKKIESKANK